MLYLLANNGVRYWTGRLQGGRQIIIGPSLPSILVYMFNNEGVLLENQVVALNSPPIWDTSSNVYVTDRPFISATEVQIASILENIGCTPQTIQILEFYDDDNDVGIKDLPSVFEEYLDDPDMYSTDDKESLEASIQEWRNEKRFVFVWGEELWVSKDGETLSS